MSLIIIPYWVCGTARPCSSLAADPSCCRHHCTADPRHFPNQILMKSYDFCPEKNQEFWSF